MQTLTFGAETLALPPALAGAPVHFGIKDDGRILVGGPAGLYAIGGTGTASVSSRAVLDVYESDAVGFLVATEEGVFVYDGTLLPSQLDDALDGDLVANFTPRGDELWFASQLRLYLLDGTGLYAFDEMLGVASLTTHAGGRIGVGTSSGAFSLMVPDGADWQRLDLEGEVDLDALAPSDDRIFGVVDGALLERLARPRDGAIVWRPVSLVEDDTDPGATGVTHLVVDPMSGAVWVLQPGLASRIDGDRVGTIALPSLGAITSARVTMDGALWVSDSASLVRIGSDEPPLSFETHVKPFSDKNCARCHAPMLGISTLVLDSAEDWSANIDEIIRQVEEGRMPADAMPLIGGSADLPRRWLSGGMQP